MRRFPRSSTSWVLVASLVVVFALVGAIVVSMLPSTSSAPGATPNAVISPLTESPSAPMQPGATPTATPILRPTTQPSPFLTSVRLVTSTPKPTSTAAIPELLATSTAGPRKPFKASNIVVGTRSDVGEFSGAYGAWSPDGRYYAFTKESAWVKATDGRRAWKVEELWLIRSDATNSLLLVKNGSNAAWARDSSSLFYFSFEPRDLVSATNNLDLHEIRPDGTAHRLLVSGAALSGFKQIQVMPSGDLAFVKDRRTMAIFERATQTSRSVLTGIDLSTTVGDSGVLYAPQGDRIAYVMSRQLWVADVSGAAAAKVAEAIDGIWSVKWSPDGRYLAYGGSGSVWVVGRDGQGVRKVVSMEQLAANYDPRTASLNPVDWSPDGNVIFFAFSPMIRVPDSTYVVDFGGGPPKLLLANHVLYALSPTGDRAAFAFNVEDNQTIRLVLTIVSY